MAGAANPCRFWAATGRIADIGGGHDEKSRWAANCRSGTPSCCFCSSQHQAGYTADQLAIALHERDVPAVTVRAELSRLRALVPASAVQGRPYRVTGLVTDVAAVREHARRG